MLSKINIKHIFNNLEYNCLELFIIVVIIKNSLLNDALILKIVEILLTTGIRHFLHSGNSIGCCFYMSQTFWEVYSNFQSDICTTILIFNALNELRIDFEVNFILTIVGYPFAIQHFLKSCSFARIFFEDNLEKMTCLIMLYQVKVDWPVDYVITELQRWYGVLIWILAWKHIIDRNT